LVDASAGEDARATADLEIGATGARFSSRDGLAARINPCPFKTSCLFRRVFRSVGMLYPPDLRGSRRNGMPCHGAPRRGFLMVEMSIMTNSFAQKSDFSSHFTIFIDYLIVPGLLFARFHRSRTLQSKADSHPAKLRRPIDNSSEELRQRTALHEHCQER